MIRIGVFRPLYASAHRMNGGGHDATVNEATLLGRVQSLLRISGLGPDHVIWIGNRAFLRERSIGLDVLLVVLTEMPELPPHWLGSVPDALPKIVLAADPLTAALYFRRYRILEIVPIDRLEDLSFVFREAYTHTTLGRAATIFSSLDNLSLTLRNWALQALAAYPPQVKVSASPGFALNPASVRKEWERKIGRSSPKEFLRWILLVHASGFFASHVFINAIAAELHVSVGILDRAAKCLLNRPLAQMGPTAGQEIRSEFDEYLARILLPSRDPCQDVSMFSPSRDS